MSASQNRGLSSDSQHMKSKSSSEFDDEVAEVVYPLGDINGPRVGTLIGSKTFKFPSLIR